MELNKQRRTGFGLTTICCCWWFCCCYWAHVEAASVITSASSTYNVSAGIITTPRNTDAADANLLDTSDRRFGSNETSATSAPVANVTTVQSGDTAFLACRGTLREEHGVSWIRRRDFSILAADMQIYSHDERVRVSVSDSPEPTWTLLIKFIRKDDEGIYDCKISTRRGVSSQSIELRVVEPQAVVVGAEDVYIGVGSPFTITCVITNTLKPPEYVLWHLDSKPLNFGSDHGRWLHGAGHVTASGGGVAAYGNGAQGASGTPWALGTAGHSVIFKAGPPSVSQLTVHSATATDSGRYTCQPSSGLPASTQVHVALGNEMAAIQAGDAAGRAFRWMSLLASVTVSLLHSLRWSQWVPLHLLPPR